MHASIRPAATHLPCTAAMVGLRKSWIRRHRSTYMTCSWWNLPSGVSRMATHSSAPSLPTMLLEVVPGAEVLPGAGQDDDPHVVVGVGAVEAGVEGVDQRAVLRVGDLGPVHRDGRHGPLDLVADHRLILRHGSPPSSASTLRVGCSAGSPRPLRRHGLAGQAEHPFADHVSLDLVGAGEDRRRLIVEPGPLPRAVAGVVVGIAPQRRGADRARRGRGRGGACSSRSSTA